MPERQWVWGVGTAALVMVAGMVLGMLLNGADYELSAAIPRVAHRLGDISSAVEAKLHARPLSAAASMEGSIRGIKEAIAKHEAETSGKGTKLIVEASNGGSCYGDCFSMKSVGPETGCPYRCVFKQANLESSKEAADADMLWRFFDTYWSPSMGDRRRRKGQLLVLFIGESAAHYSPLADASYTHLFNYSYSLNLNATFSNGGCQLPALDYVVKMTGPKPPVSFEEKKKRPEIASFISNCGIVANKRLEYLSMVLQSSRGALRHEGYGGCMHTMSPWVTNDNSARWTGNRTVSWKNRMKVHIIAHHLFTWAAENADCDGYHTEKIYQALAAGSVPIYLGGKTIRTVIPEGSAIIARDFKNSDALAQHLVELANNETLYNRYHEWRARPMEARLLKIWRGNIDPSLNAERHCTYCRYAHTKPQGRVEPDKSCLRPMWG